MKMMVPALGLSATALSASAFLLPPNMPSTADVQEGARNTLEGLSFLNPFDQTVQLECPGCLYAKVDENSHGYSWVSDSKNSLVLRFSVSYDGQSIELNNLPFYPLRTLPIQLYASQTSGDISLADILLSGDAALSPPLRLSYELGVPHTTIVEEDESQLHTIKMHILAVGDQSVNVDSVIVTAHQDTNGGFTILSVDIASNPLNEATTPADDADQRECKSLSPLFCRWKAILESKLNDVKHSLNKTQGKPRPDCHRRPRPAFPGSIPPPPPAGMKHGFPRPHMRHPHHGHRHHGLHSFMQVARRVAVTVLIPILIGIAAGMVASLLGMIVGSVIGYLWIRFRRGGKRGNCVMIVEQEGDVAVSEKERLLVVEDEEAAPPEYVEKNGKEVQ